MYDEGDEEESGQLMIRELEKQVEKYDQMIKASGVDNVVKMPRDDPKSEVLP